MSEGERPVPVLRLTLLSVQRLQSAEGSVGHGAERRVFNEDCCTASVTGN